MPRTPATFSARLAALRQAAGLSQSALSERAGLARSCVGHYEAGRRDPTWAAIQKLAAALAVSTDDLRDR